MTSAQLKTNINTDITSKTSAKSISPTNVGGNMDDIVDYIDQEITATETIISEATAKTSGTFASVSNTTINSGGGTIPYDFTKVTIGAEVDNHVAIRGTSDEYGKKYTINNPSTYKFLDIVFKNSTAYLAEDGTHGLSYTLPPLETVSFEYAQDDAGLKIYYVEVVERSNFASDRDAVPTESSTKLVESGGTFDAIAVKANDDEVVKLEGDQAINGLKSFTGTIEVLYPTDDSQAANKSYVDLAINEYAINNLHVVKVQKTTITEAQVLNLFTTPVTILDASEPLTIKYPLSIYIVKPGGTGYTLGNMNFAIIDDANFNTAQFAVSGGLTTSIGFVQYNILGGTTGTGERFSEYFQLKALTSNPTVGTGDIDVYLTYITLYV